MEANGRLMLLRQDAQSDNGTLKQRRQIFELGRIALVVDSPNFRLDGDGCGLNRPKFWLLNAVQSIPQDMAKSFQGFGVVAVILPFSDVHGVKNLLDRNLIAL